tara:strand:- start:283 stop:639 length:357 start_codon:yes stop_codon:yes gene_type:complete
VIFLSLLFSASWTIFLLFLWFRTNWLLFYGELLGASSLLQIPKFKRLNEEGVASDFLLFLWTEFQDHKFLRFPVKLLTCVYCFAFWVSLIVVSFYGFELLPLNYLLSVLIFKKIKRDE